jgi:hypothetical protein
MTTVERFEQALIDMRNAKDSEGRYIILGPRSAYLNDNPLRARIPTAHDFDRYLEQNPSLPRHHRRLVIAARDAARDYERELSIREGV